MKHLTRLGTVDLAMVIPRFWGHFGSRKVKVTQSKVQKSFMPAATDIIISNLGYQTVTRAC